MYYKYLALKHLNTEKYVTIKLTENNVYLEVFYFLIFVPLLLVYLEVYD